MELERTEAFDAETSEGLPAEAAVAAGVQKVIVDLEALRNAPTIDPYAGPAILDGRAAAVFFHEIFGHRVEGHRQKDEEEGQTFARKIGQQVMPSFLDVYDDPGLGALNGVPLNGYYPFDDEGIAGARTSLVDDGVLRGFLLSRSPVRGFPHSNGHGRREHGRRVVARQANLVVDPAYTTSPEALKQRLIDEIVRQHRPFGLRFHEITGGYTNTTRQGAQAFKVLPVLVYRIYPDGREELVRGADLEGTPLAALSRIEAAANDFATFNGVCGAESGWVPVSATSPSLLISQIDVTRREKNDDRPPLLPAPAPALRSVRQR
jgi:predicted Zn-dependent protease